MRPLQCPISDSVDVLLRAIIENTFNALYTKPIRRILCPPGMAATNASKTHGTTLIVQPYCVIYVYTDWRDPCRLASFAEFMDIHVVNDIIIIGRENGFVLFHWMDSANIAHTTIQDVPRLGTSHG